MGTRDDGVSFTATFGVHRVTVDEFMASVTPLEWYRDWDHVIDTLCRDRHERRIIDTLAAELAANGRFRTRLRVHGGELANGYHRFCATVVAAGAGRAEPCLDIWVGDDDHLDPDDPDSSYALELTYHLEAPELTDDEVSDAFFAGVRSLRLDADTWAESDGASCVTGRWTIAYLGLDESRARDVNNAAIASLADAGVAATLLDVATYRHDGDEHLG